MRSNVEALNSERGTAPERACRSLVLGWTDAQSGERLVVDVRAPAGFLQELSVQGFEILADSAPAAPEGWGRRVSVVAVAHAEKGECATATRAVAPRRKGA